MRNCLDSNFDFLKKNSEIEVCEDDFEHDWLNKGLYRVASFAKLCFDSLKPAIASVFNLDMVALSDLKRVYSVAARAWTGKEEIIEKYENLIQIDSECRKLFCRFSPSSLVQI